MKIVIKEMSADRNDLLIYLMTADNKPLRCEITTRALADEVINTFTPENERNLKTIIYKYPQIKLK